MPLGSFMMSLGGSLLQVLIPLICAWAFLFQQEDPLMLLGGPAAEVEGHDWEAILTALGWLHLDHSLARLAWVLGAGLMIGALAWAAAISLSALRGDAAPSRSR